MAKKKMRMCAGTNKTFEEGFAEYILYCKARNLREGTIVHYQASIIQIYKRVPAATPISSLDEKTMPNFIVSLREDPNVNEVTMRTYARDLKALMRFFMKSEYLNTPDGNRQFDRASPTPLPLKSYTLSTGPTPSV